MVTGKFPTQSGLIQKEFPCNDVTIICNDDLRLDINGSFTCLAASRNATVTRYIDTCDRWRLMLEAGN